MAEKMDPIKLAESLKAKMAPELQKELAGGDIKKPDQEAPTPEMKAEISPTAEREQEKRIREGLVVIPAKIDFEEGPLDSSAAEDLERKKTMEQAPAQPEVAPEKTEEPHPEEEILGLKKAEAIPDFSADLKEPRLAFLAAEKKKDETAKKVENLRKIRGGSETVQQRKAEIEKEHEQHQKDFERLKDDYDKSLGEYAKSLYKKKEAELAGDPEKDKKLKEYVKTEIFEEVALKEFERLNQAKQENLPAGQKKWYHDCLYKFSQMPKWERWAISGGVATGVAFSGLAGAGAVAGYFGIRVGRAAIGTLAAGLTDQILGRRIKEGKAKTEQEIKTEIGEKIEAAKNFDEIKAMVAQQSSLVREKLEVQRKKEHRQHIIKTIAMVGVAGGTTAGLGFLENYLAAYGYLPSLKGELMGGRPRGPAVPPPEAPGAPGPSAAGLEQATAPQFQEMLVGKGESPLLLAKQMYINNAENFGYKPEMGDIKKWAEMASARHIVGQYISERPLEFDDLIKEIGEPPEDPIKLDQWLNKVPKSTFNEILHEEVPNLVYEGDFVRVTASGDIVAYGPDNQPRFGHIEVVKPPEVISAFEKVQQILTGEIPKEVIPWQAEAPRDLGPFGVEEISEGRPQISAMPEEVGEMPTKIEVERPQGDALPASFEELKQMGFKEEEISDLTVRAKLVGKNFVSGNEYEDYTGKLRESGYFDRVNEQGLTVRPTLEAISERIDRMIAGTMGMELETYNKIKVVNLEKFVFAKPETLAEHLEWRPARRVIDEYLRINKFIEPDDAKGTLGDFFKKIMRIDIGQPSAVAGEVAAGWVAPEEELLEIKIEPSAEIERPIGEPLPVIEKEAEVLGLSSADYDILKSEAQKLDKNFVSGKELENYFLKKGYTPEDVDLFFDKKIADTLGMSLETYKGVEGMNLEKFVTSEPQTLAQHLEWRPIKRVTDEYLRRNKFFEPDDLKGNLGRFLEKIMKIDIGK